MILVNLVILVNLAILANFIQILNWMSDRISDWISDLNQDRTFVAIYALFRRFLETEKIPQTLLLLECMQQRSSAKNCFFSWIMKSYFCVIILMNCSQVVTKHYLIETGDTGNEDVGSHNENEDNKLITETGL